MNLVLSANSFGKCILCLIFLGLSVTGAQSQTSPEPERTQLLNGLRVVLLPRTDDKVLIKLRIHSGAAFDLGGKAGTTALLGDLLFPDPTTREYFTEEMQGRLNVSTDYDAITITMEGRAREFERMIEIMRNALVATDLSPTTVAKVRDGRIKIIRDTSISPAIVADRAVATRLFGEFPYGTPSTGTVESLERVGRPDLIFARERFLNPNNATLVIIGGVQPNRAWRALRQLLGVWRKSEQIVPATFKQPASPDPRILIVNGPNDQSVEVRVAVRGLSRQDGDAAAAALLATIIKRRWEKELPELSRSPIFVRHDAFARPGILVMGTSIEPLLTKKALAAAHEIMKSLATSPVSTAELAEARADVLSTRTKELSKPDAIANVWLDMDTYHVSPMDEQVRALTLVSPSDVQRVASRLFSSTTVATVVVGNSELLKTQLEGFGKIEMMGTVNSATENKTPESKPATKSTTKP